MVSSSSRASAADDFSSPTCPECLDWPFWEALLCVPAAALCFYKGLDESKAAGVWDVAATSSGGAMHVLLFLRPVITAPGSSFVHNR